MSSTTPRVIPGRTPQANEGVYRVLSLTKKMLLIEHSATYPSVVAINPSKAPRSAASRLASRLFR